MSLFTKITSLFRGGVATAPSTTTTATNASRNVARERLSVILASQRGSEMLVGVDMKLLQEDVLEVVQVRKSFKTLLSILYNGLCLHRYRKCQVSNF